MHNSVIVTESINTSPLLYIPIDYYKFEKERHQSME